MHDTVARPNKVVYGSSRRHDLRTHLTFRAGYSIHRACFLLIWKGTSCGAPSYSWSRLYLLLHLLPSQRKFVHLYSAVSRGYIVIPRTEIRRWSFAASWNLRACFISGPTHSPYAISSTLALHIFADLPSLFQFSFFHVLNFLYLFPHDVKLIFTLHIFTTIYFY